MKLEGEDMSLTDIFLLGIKTIVCYFFLIFTLKVMGKREIGKVSTFDIVVFFVISELFSLSLNDLKGNLLHSIVPIVIIVILQIATAKISLKNSHFRKYMEGTSSFIIFNGKIDFKVMKKNRYNTDDLLFQLRAKNIESIDQVKFAILEQNGTLNIYQQECKLIDPFPFVQDGKLNNEVLTRNNISLEYLYELIFKEGYTNIDEIFLMYIFEDKVLIYPFEKPFEIE